MIASPGSSYIRTFALLAERKGYAYPSERNLGTEEWLHPHLCAFSLVGALSLLLLSCFAPSRAHVKIE